MSRVAVVAGASGLVGRCVVRRLRDGGWHVRGITRDPRRLEGACDEVVCADARRPGALHGCCDGAEAVVSCLGASVELALGRGWRGYMAVDVPANRALIQEAQRAAVRRFVYVSVFGAKERPGVNYFRAHAEVERALEAAGIEHAVVRPAGIFGAFLPLVMMAKRGPLPQIGDGSARTNPVHEDDVAQVCVAALEGPPAALDVGGPEVLTRRRILEMACEAAGKPVRLRPAPAWTMRMAGRITRPVHPRMGDLIGFVADVMTRDVIAPPLGRQRLGDCFARATDPAAMRNPATDR